LNEARYNDGSESKEFSEGKEVLYSCRPLYIPTVDEGEQSCEKDKLTEGRKAQKREERTSLTRIELKLNRMYHHVGESKKEETIPTFTKRCWDAFLLKEKKRMER